MIDLRWFKVDLQWFKVDPPWFTAVPPWFGPVPGRDNIRGRWYETRATRYHVDQDWFLSDRRATRLAARMNGTRVARYASGGK